MDIHLSIKEIDELVSKTANDIIASFAKSKSIKITYDLNGKFVEERTYTSIFSNELGLYAFWLKKGEKFGIVYIGKSESKNDTRLYQHIVGGGADSLASKHGDIKKAIEDDYEVYLTLFSSPDFTKSSLICLETEVATICKNKLSEVFTEIQSWNKRIG